MKAQMYTLWRKKRDGRLWERISGAAMRKEAAVRFFQDRLLSNAMGQLDPGYEYRLRPVREPKQEMEAEA